jgi:hypothetical protein
MRALAQGSATPSLIRGLGSVTGSSIQRPRPTVKFMATSPAVIRGLQLPVQRPQGRPQPLLFVAVSAGLTFAVLCVGVAFLDQDWVLLALPACLAGPVLAVAAGSSVVAAPGRLRAWGRDLPRGSIAFVAGVNVGPGEFVAGSLRVILVASNGAARWVSARGFTDDQIRAMAAQLGAVVAIDWDAQMSPAELAARFPGVIPLWRARPERTARASSPAQAPGVYLALAGALIVVVSIVFPIATTTFGGLSSFEGIPGIPAFTLDLGVSNNLLLAIVLAGWCAAVVGVERLVLHRGSTFSGLTLSAALVVGLVGAVEILGDLSDINDPGVSTGHAGAGIAIFFIGVSVLAIGSVIDLLAHAEPGRRVAPAD